MKALNGVVLCIALGFSCGGVHAELLYGQSLSYQYFFPDLASPCCKDYSFVVGSGVEVPDLVTEIATLDVSDTQVTVQFIDGFGGFNEGAFNGFVLTGLAESGFTSATVDGASTLAGFDSQNVSYDLNNVWVNLQGQRFEPNQRLILDIAGPVPVVPEPSAAAAMLGGLAFLAWFLRGRNGTRVSELVR